ncbi:hypothetical protein VHUM_00360 [Vanrija humicola]|uniref:Sulfhydryl oxidase n=1 Tax=Vanrija humicola TaxID=5417 RepID=A0A7D8V4N8_VANHU|nr:hypothetical protein VHUM_00360 [Vanrija humicola]
MTAPTPATEPKRTTKETHPHLPPGLILDENGKVCKVCNTWQDFGKIKMRKKAASSSSSSAAPAAAAASVVGATAAAAATTTRANCPPDTAELGRATWAFLHTTAAYYPTNPTPAQQGHMRALLASLPALYPCGWCADDFGRAIAAAPPVVSSRESLSRWLCERHNEVNVKLGKKAFSCDWAALDARWKDGPKDGSCDCECAAVTGSGHVLTAHYRERLDKKDAIAAKPHTPLMHATPRTYNTV